MTTGERIKARRKEIGMSAEQLARILGVSPATIYRYENGDIEKVPISIIEPIAKALRTTQEYLMGWDGHYQPPRIAQNVLRFRTIGTVAAGYGAEAFEDWTDEDTIDIPAEWLRGRPKEDFFALRVHGDSMYPTFREGDRVLVLRQSTLNHPGDVGVVRYNGTEATLKCIDYVYGENWMRLRPENPKYPPVTIENVDLEECQVLGIPWLTIREHHG